MHSFAFIRFMAFLLDYLLILVYAMLLFCMAFIIRQLFRVELSPVSPVTGELIGLFTLTLPIFFYFYLSERSVHRGTFGKRRLGIAIGNQFANKSGQILLRNVLKFLPWEVAHMGVHWIVYYTSVGSSIPVWVWLTLVLPQLTVLMYIASILWFGDSSWYDKLAGTRIVLR